MENNSLKNIPRTAIVVFHNGAFGGSSKRITNLFIHINQQYPDKFYLFVNRHLYKQIHEIYDKLPEDRIKVIEIPSDNMTEKVESLSDTPRYFADNIADPLEVDKRYSFARKIYWYYKNKHRQYNLYKKIEKLRVTYEIKGFFAVFSGVLPLIFYLNEPSPKASVIFSDTDSWFTDVLSDMKKLWYRKYYSFNYALENCDLVDFLSPYILDGVKKLGINVKKSSTQISPCSFVDYSKCLIGDKSNFEISFCSRLEPDKNPMIYLEAAKVIAKKYPKVKFHILGEGTLVKEIKSFIDSNGLSGNVNFQFHKNPPEIFKNTSAFVSIQNHTNYPSQSVLEAMACGNAIIASNRGDTKLLINKDNGILIDINKDELVLAIEKLINNKSIAYEMGKNGREFAMKNHKIDRYSDYFLGLIEEANLRLINRK